MTVPTLVSPGHPDVTLHLPDRRRRALWTVSILLIVLAAVVVAGTLLADVAAKPDLLNRRQAPSLSHPFGTDWLGRDLLARTLVGLRLSLVVGTLAAAVSAVIALLLSIVAASLGRWADTAVGWLVDLFLAVPHLVLLILVAFAFGGGLTGVVVAVAVTHWPSLARLLRAEGRRVMEADYVHLSRNLGKSRWWIGRKHLLRHLLPQFTVGLVLLFPHAILHEAALSFLGFGLPPDSPAVGIILADAMRELSSGAWWLALLPGLALLAVVKAVDVLGDQVRALTDPRSVHE
ncbi:MAG TPA: ABC transporter permease [Acidimicrobiia bacterium]|jgi:peptide/nickel transport system permease protein|nr:ABC transporter permease [Acidimicrobiia bacterium]